MRKILNSAKKITALILALLIVMSFGTIAQENEIFVLVDGEKVEFDAKPIMKNDRVLVPMRKIFEKLEAEVLWDPLFERVIVNYNENDQIIMYINEELIFKNGVQVKTDVAPFIQEDRTYVPLRFVSESLNMSVEWSDALQTVFIVPMDKQMQYIPFGEFMTIPCPYSVNRNYITLEYTNENGVATAKYDLVGEKLSDLDRYGAILEANGYENIKKADEKDTNVIYYGKGMVVKYEVTEEGKILTVTLYRDSTGETVKDFLKGE